MTEGSVPRRLGIAGVSLGCAALLFHGNVSASLVTRGDEALHAGDTNGAVRSYERAMRLDHDSAVAADRYAFVMLVRRRPGDALLAYAAADRVLERFPGNTRLLVDRGFASARLGRWRRAEFDFGAAAAGSRDPRYAHFAAHLAARAGDRSAAQQHLLVALRLDPTYAPARMLLRRFTP